MMKEDAISHKKSEQPRLEKAEELEIEQFLKNVKVQEDSSNNTQMEIATTATLNLTPDSNRKMTKSKIL